MPGPHDPTFEDEVLRINARFNAEIIEELSVCPYARGARSAGASARRVLLLREPTLAPLLEVVAELAPRVEIEVAQVILPLLELDAPAFLELASALGRAHASMCPERPVFVHAAFHPELPYATSTPQRLVPFFRRSPDPMIQLVRLAVLDSLHEGRPRGTQFFDGSTPLDAFLSGVRESITDRITRDNHEEAMAGGLARIEAIQADIRRDRDASYARFEAAPRPWGGAR